MMVLGGLALWVGGGTGIAILFARMIKVGMSELQPYKGVERRKVPR